MTAWPPVVAVVGATASGKSSLAMALAESIGGQIVNADAYQVYRGMDIGTAKPSAQDRARVPHHLLDILDVTEELSVADYQRRARATFADLAAEGVPAVLVGGSGLYVRAALDDLRFPGSDPAIRARWESELDRLGAVGLHAELARRDAAAAAHILPTNGRRIVRALEVGELTGQPFPAQLPVDGPALLRHVSVALAVPRPELDVRIDQRVHRMFEQGLAAEVQGLLGQGLAQGRTASRALGYPQVIDLLAGRTTAEQARAGIAAATRAYARRQERWFRRDPRTVWLDPARSVHELVGEIVGRLRAGA